MTEVQITQYNKLIVNYQTFEFTPSNYSQIVIDDPWYIDTSSAPDFVDIAWPEVNELNDVEVPPDLYSVSDYKLYGWQKNLEYPFTFSCTNKSHENIVKEFIKVIDNNIPDLNLSYYIYDNYIYYYPGNFYCTILEENTDPTQEQLLLCPVTKKELSAAYISIQYFPLIKSLTITLDYRSLTTSVPEHTVTVTTVNRYSPYETKVHNVQYNEGTYTFEEYVNPIWKVVHNKNWNSGFFEYIYKYNHSPYNRFSNYFVTIDSNVFDTLLQKFICFMPDYYEHHKTIMPAVNRCLTVSSGTWHVQDFIDFVNDADVDFTLSSNTHYISINCNTPFIINPAASMNTSDTDTEETFANSHIFIRHPMYRYINCSVTANGKTVTCKGNFTPAEFLRWIYANVGISVLVIGNKIKVNGDITVGSNPFFDFPGNGLVTNKCGLYTQGYHFRIKGSNKEKLTVIPMYKQVTYEPTLTTFGNGTQVSITNNIITALNGKVKWG